MDLRDHFGDMHFAAFVLAEGAGATSQSDLEYQVGEGAVKDRTGAQIAYRWAFLRSPTQGLHSGFLGTGNTSHTFAVELSREETRDAIRRCNVIDDTPTRFACFDRVVAQMVSDCQNSMTIEECHEACFYDLSQCRGLDL